jgi:hypothetical protein
MNQLIILAYQKSIGYYFFLLLFVSVLRKTRTVWLIIFLNEKKIWKNSEQISYTKGFGLLTKRSGSLLEDMTNNKSLR